MLPNYWLFTKVFLRIGGLRVRVLIPALLWPQDLGYFSSYHPILRDTLKGNTRETAGNDMVICLNALLFHPMPAIKIR